MTPSSPAPPTPTLRVSGPADIIDAVPYLVGFHPSDSLVLIGMNAEALVCTMRMDLANALGAEPGDLTLPHMIARMVQGGAARFFAVQYADAVARPDDVAVRAVAARVGHLADELGCRVWENLLVAGGRWWEVWCEDATCCPPEGNRLLLGASRFSAEATYAGMPVLRDRDELAASLAPEPGRERLLPLIYEAEHESVTALVDGADELWRRRAVRELRAAAEGGGEPTDEQLARMGVALSDIAVRDAIWTRLDAGRLDGSGLWRTLARRLPAPYDAPACFLVGWHAWRHGEGALANIAADRALTSQPGYSAAELLIETVCRGLNPHTTPPLGETSPTGNPKRRKRKR